MRTNLESDLLCLLTGSSATQTIPLASRLGCSVQELSEVRKHLKQTGELDSQNNLSEQVRQEIRDHSPQRAVILAAGMGMRALPLSAEGPKALLEVYGETLIERLIQQLQEAGVTEIEVITGYHHEALEYLADKWNVRLIYNPDYAETNNLHSLKLCSSLENCYIVPSDLWFETNPFRPVELRSWYLISRVPSASYPITTDEDLTIFKGGEGEAKSMVGIAYINREDAPLVRQRITNWAAAGHPGDFWEDALWDKDRLLLSGREIPTQDWMDINTFEDLRLADEKSTSLAVKSMRHLMNLFGVPMEEVQSLTILKKGMTNRSFLFEVHGEKFIMRLPGEGTDQLISRKQEADVYSLLKGKGVTDEVVYLNPDNGYKITRYLDHARVCDAFNEEDTARCMDLLHRFHDLQLQADHSFDLFEKMDLYRSFRNGEPSRYPDYLQVRERILALEPFVRENAWSSVLCHIDSVPDNFLFYPDPETGEEELVLIDWEYAGNQDPLVDLAMFSIYSLYDWSDMERLMKQYLHAEPDELIEARMMAYVAVCGFVWSEWCEYKALLGVDFGAYALAQYEYAREFSLLAAEKIRQLDESVKEQA